MFGWFKKKPKPRAVAEKIAHQPPGEVFPWPKQWRLTALDEAIIAVPAAILSDDEVIGSIIHADDNAKLNLPTVPPSTPGAQIMIWLQVGQSAWLSKSCQAVIVAQAEGDIVARRFRVTEVAQQTDAGAAPDPADK